VAENIWYFENVNLFNVMCPNKTAQYGQTDGHFKEYDKGETIYFTGDKARTMYLIVKGKVRILNYTEQGDEVVKAILGRGEMFGELALLGQEVRSEVAEAMDSPTTICPVTVEQAHELMKDDKDFTLSVYKWLGLRVRKMERRLDNLVFKDVRQRLVDFIHDLAVEKGQKQEDGCIHIEHFYTHKNMANLIGTSRQTVTTTLNELRQEGLLDFDRRHIYVKDSSAF
jgi:CRP-like cAMP-binding protein